MAKFGVFFTAAATTAAMVAQTVGAFADDVKKQDVHGLTPELGACIQGGFEGVISQRLDGFNRGSIYHSTFRHGSSSILVEAEGAGENSNEKGYISAYFDQGEVSTTHVLVHDTQKEYGASSHLTQPIGSGAYPEEAQEMKESVESMETQAKIVVKGCISKYGVGLIPRR